MEERSFLYVSIVKEMRYFYSKFYKIIIIFNIEGYYYRWTIIMIVLKH
jgi:hypothetical protein